MSQLSARHGRPRSTAAAALRSRSTAGPTPAIAGDTLASALLANGVRLVGRSFKYHRPRGILTAGSEEPNALVELAHRRAARAQYPRHDDRAVRRPGSARARTAGRRWISTLLAVNRCRARSSARASTTRPSCGRRRSGRRSTSRSSAAPPALAGRRGDPIPTPTRRPTPSATCWSSAAGPAGLMAALTAAAPGARVILCR